MDTKRKLVLFTFIISMIMILGSAMTVSAKDTDQFTDTAGNLFFSGNESSIEGGLFLGGYGAGKDLKVKKSKARDSMALAGMNITVDSSETDSSIYLAGRTLDVKKTRSGGNIIMAGMDLTVDDKTTCSGAYLTGKNVSFSGSSKALGIHASIAALNGNVRGNANIEADKVVIGKNTVVSGKLKIRASEKPVIEKGAKIADLDFTKISGSSDSKAAPTAGERFADALRSALYWAAAMVLLGLLLFLAGRAHMERAGEMIKKRPGQMIGSGAIALITIPAAAVLCLITVIGAPAGVFTGLVYTLTILISTAFTGSSLGSLLLKKMPALPAGLLGIVILELAEAVPYLGVLVHLSAIIFTLGYLIQNIYLTRIKKKKTASASLPVQ